MSLTPGTRLGVFLLGEPIGRGAMGEVYRATDTKLKRQVAIKMLPPSFAADPDRLARFQREAEVLASLNHPNIAAIYGLEESGGVTALVMELVEGDDLSQRIAHGAIPVDEATAIARQVADALEAAHEHSVIHRDLKPANIKIRADGVVKVLDFGLAKAIDPVGAMSASASQAPTLTSPALMTGAGVILGTAAYMAPEQARGKTVDKRADIWAFGAVLFEMLTGQRAVAGDDLSDVLANVLKTEPDWARLPADVSASVRAVLQRCLQKDPKQRLRDIGDVRLALEGAFDTAAPQTTATSSAKGGRLAWMSFAVAAGVIVAMAVPTVRHLREASPDQSLPVRFEVQTPPTSEPGSFALSPDGRQFAFVATRDGASTLWVRPLDEVTARALPGTEGASYPFWAPDSKALGFFADAKLKRIDLAGSVTQVLANVSVGPVGGTWNRDDVIVFQPGGQGPLMRVAATGGAPVVVTQLAPGQVSHRWPEFLPDGRRFLFTVTEGPPATRGVFVGALDGGEPTRVLPDDTSASFVSPGSLLLVRQGVLIALPFDATRAAVTGDAVLVARGVGVDPVRVRGAFAVSTTGVLVHRAISGFARRQQLVWVDRAGTLRSTVEPSEESPPTVDYPEVAPDGRRVAVNRNVQGNGDVWLIDVGRGFATRFTFDSYALPHEARPSE